MSNFFDDEAGVSGDENGLFDDDVEENEENDDDRNFIASEGEGEGEDIFGSHRLMDMRISQQEDEEGDGSDGGAEEGEEGSDAEGDDDDDDDRHGAREEKRGEDWHERREEPRGDDDEPPVIHPADETYITMMRIIETEHDQAQKEFFVEAMSALSDPELTDENARIELICQILHVPSLNLEVQDLHAHVITHLIQPVMRMVYTLCVSETDLTLTTNDELKTLLVQSNALSHFLHYRHIMLHPETKLFARNINDLVQDMTPPSWPETDNNAQYVKRWCLVQAHKRSLRFREENERCYVYEQMLVDGVATHYWERKADVETYFKSLITTATTTSKLEAAYTETPKIFEHVQPALCANQPLFPVLQLERGFISCYNGIYNTKNDTFITYQELNMDIKRNRAAKLRKCRASLRKLQYQRDQAIAQANRARDGWDVNAPATPLPRSIEDIEDELEGLTEDIDTLEEEDNQARVTLQTFLDRRPGDLLVTDTDSIVASVFIPCYMDNYHGPFNGIDRNLSILNNARVAREYETTQRMNLPVVMDRFNGKEMEFLFDGTTKRFESILNTQQFDSVTKFWLMFFLGRTLHPLQPREGGDNFQMVPVLFGLARTGKSLVLNILRKMFPEDKVADMENVGEQVFGHESEAGKWLSICSELEPGSNIDVATLKKKLEGTTVHVSRKNKIAIDTKWTAHAVFASNTPLTIVFKNQQGSLARRLAVFPFMNIPKDSDATLEQQIIEFELLDILRKCNMCYLMGRAIITKHFNSNAWRAMPSVVREQRDEMDIFTDDVFHFLMAQESISLGKECVCRMSDLSNLFQEYCQSVPFMRAKMRRVEWGVELYSSAFQKLGCVVHRAYLPENVLRHESVDPRDRDYKRFKDAIALANTNSIAVYDHQLAGGRRHMEETADNDEGRGRNVRRRVEGAGGAGRGPGEGAAAAAAPPAHIAGPRPVNEYVFGICIQPRNPARVIPSFVEWQLTPSEDERIAFHVLEPYVRRYMHDCYRTENVAYVFDAGYMAECLRHKGFNVEQDEGDEDVWYAYATFA